MKQSNEQLKSPIETRLESPLDFMLGEGQCTQIMSFFKLMNMILRTSGLSYTRTGD